MATVRSVIFVASFPLCDTSLSFIFILSIFAGLRRAGALQWLGDATPAGDPWPDARIRAQLPSNSPSNGRWSLCQTLKQDHEPKNLFSGMSWSVLPVVASDAPSVPASRAHTLAVLAAGYVGLRILRTCQSWPATEAAARRRWRISGVAPCQSPSAAGGSPGAAGESPGAAGGLLGGRWGTGRRSSSQVSSAAAAAAYSGIRPPIGT